MPTAGALEARYAFVDAIPESLFDAVVANGHGALRVRAESIVRLRGELLAGRLPRAELLAWPDEPWRTPLVDALVRSRIREHCEGNPKVTDQVLLGVLGATQRAQRSYDELLAEWTLAARDRDRRIRIVGLIPGEGGERGEALLDEAAWDRIRRDAIRIAGEVALEALEQADRTWSEAARDWIRIREILDGVAAACSIDRGRVSSYLQATDWRHATALRKLLADLPPLRALLRVLGRATPREIEADDPELEAPGGPIRRDVVTESPIREVGTVEIRGVERSDELARMLASEAVLRRHPTMRWLWHARRAERSLLTYHAESTYTTRIVTQQQFGDGAARVHTRAERGPVIVILDTSGSMTGPSETLAKAIVLQVLCTAGMESRPVYVYNFSGAGELVEHALGVGSDALARALAFLAMSFSGGTEIEEALRRAVERAETEAWSRADLLIVTDGFLDEPGADEFDPAILRMVEAARKRRRFRVHVALTARLASDVSLTDPHRVVKALADDIHDVSAWIDGIDPSA